MMPLILTVKMGLAWLILFAGGATACVGGYMALKSGEVGGGMYGRYRRRDQPVSYWLMVVVGLSAGVAMLLFAVALPFLRWR